MHEAESSLASLRSTLAQVIAEMRTHEGNFGERTRLTILKWADQLALLTREDGTQEP
jgi:hypothetical protein